MRLFWWWEKVKKNIVRLEVANRMYERHTLLSNLLISLGVDEETAADDACKIEHHISEKSFEAIKKFIEESNNK